MNLRKAFLLLFLEVILVALVLYGLFTLGKRFDNSWLFLTIGLFLNLSWHLYFLFHLLDCLKSGKRCKAPMSLGIWQEIFAQLVQMQRQHNSKQKKLINILDNYRVFVEAIPDAAVILKQNNDIEWFNKNAQRYLGLKKKKHSGKNLSQLFNQPELEEFLYDSSQGKQADKALELALPVDTNRILSFRIVPYPKGFRLLLARDISKIHKISKMRKDFIANVSHELRTPLTVISGYLETLVEHFTEDETFLHPIQTMQQQSLRMENIVEDLLILSKLEANEDKQVGTKLIHISSMIEGIVNDAQLLNSEKNHKIKAHIDRSLMISGNQDELRSAFSNLVNNAIRYTPKKGRIIINWYQENNETCFSVVDNGDGIAQKHLPRLTERFYRADKGRSRNSGGTGLGLAIVKHILNHHNAVLDIKSKEGKGSTFICRFNKQNS
jgi:two-component system, OmpR family, phosphate regulon sensor histidine kinase PhoR